MNSASLKPKKFRLRESGLLVPAGPVEEGSRANLADGPANTPFSPPVDQDPTVRVTHPSETPAQSPEHPGALVQDPPLGRAPYIRIHAFCETGGLISSITTASTDRRLSRADVAVSPGGIRAAAKFYESQPTPDLLVLESLASSDILFADLEALASVCDPKTKVVVIGASNDIAIYRRLMESGIAEYLVAPVGPMPVIEAVLRLFHREGAGRLGKIFAFMGVKGGTGSSTLAQNVAWAMAQSNRKILLADMDLQFGTAALNYNIDSPVGFAEQMGDVDRLDGALIERLLYKRGANLSVLAGATASHTSAEPAVETVNRMLDLVRSAFPFVVLDLPHSLSPWVRHALDSADEVILTAAPDLANLRNAQCMIDFLKAARPNDPKPRLVLNQIGTPKRVEIKPAKFASALQIDLAASIGFEPCLFSKAANNGEMIAECSKNSATARAVGLLAQDLTGNSDVVKSRESRRFWRR